MSDQNLKLFWTSKQNNFRFRSSKFSQKRIKTQKSTNNRMSSFGIIEKNMELSHIFLAVTMCIISLSNQKRTIPTRIFKLNTISLLHSIYPISISQNKNFHKAKVWQTNFRASASPDYFFLVTVSKLKLWHEFRNSIVF